MDELNKLLEFESDEESENFNLSLKCKHHPCFNDVDIYCDYTNCKSYEVENKPSKRILK